MLGMIVIIFLTGVVLGFYLSTQIENKLNNK